MLAFSFPLTLIETSKAQKNSLISKSEILPSQSLLCLIICFIFTVGLVIFCLQLECRLWRGETDLPFQHRVPKFERSSWHIVGGQWISQINEYDEFNKRIGEINANVQIVWTKCILIPLFKKVFFSLTAFCFF